MTPEGKTPPAPYILTTAGRHLSRIGVLAANMREANGTDVSGRSPAHAERVAAANDDVRTLLIDAYMNADLRLKVVEDHVTAMGTLMSQTGTVFGHYPLARSAVEISARAWWLVDPDISGPDRAARVIGDRLAGLSEMKKFRFAAIQQIVDKRQRAIAQRSSRARIRQVGPGSTTGIIGRMLGSKLGEPAYAYLSGFTHGWIDAFHELVKPVEVRHGHYVHKGQIATDGEAEGNILLLALMSYSIALRASGVVADSTVDACVLVHSAG